MIAQLDGRGRGIIAERSYCPGDIVIVEEPYAFVVAERYAGVVCGYCGIQVDHPMLALSPEDNTRYCCEKCITLDYPVHVLEATSMAGLLSTGVSGRGMDAMKLVVRIGAQRKHENNNKAVSVMNVRNGRENTYHHIRLLEANTSSCSSAAARDVSTTAKELARLSSVLSLPATEAEFLLYVIQCNAHTIVSNHDDDIAAVGLGLFPLTSMMNHSCRPNCLHQFVFETGRPPRLLMKAITHVAVGEEMLYSYVPLYQSTTARKHQLYNAYSFDCPCGRCQTHDDGVIDEIIIRLDDLDADDGGLGESLILPSQIPSLHLNKDPIEQRITQLILALQPNLNLDTNSNPNPDSTSNSSMETSHNLDAGWTNMLAFLQSSDVARFRHPAHKLLFQCYLSVLRYVCRRIRSPATDTTTNPGPGPCDDSDLTTDDSDMTSILHTACVYGLLALGCMKMFIRELQPEIGVLEGQVALVLQRYLTASPSRPNQQQPEQQQQLQQGQQQQQQPKPPSAVTGTRMDEWLGLGLGGYYYMGDPRVGGLLVLACGDGGEGGGVEGDEASNALEQGLAPGQGLAQEQGLIPAVPPSSVTATLQTLSLTLSQSSNHIKTICCASIPS